MVEEELKKEGMSQDEIDQVNKEIAEAEKSMVSKETRDAIEKAKEETRKQVEKEMAINAELKAKEEEINKLREEQKKKEEDAAKRLEELKNKVNELTESRAVINKDDPFKKPETGVDVDKMSDEQIKDIEEESARQFWGEDYALIERFRQSMK